MRYFGASTKLVNSTISRVNFLSKNESGFTFKYILEFYNLRFSLKMEAYEFNFAEKL